jgi:hypothetical protein
MDGRLDVRQEFSNRGEAGAPMSEFDDVFGFHIVFLRPARPDAGDGRGRVNEDAVHVDQQALAQNLSHVLILARGEPDSEQLDDLAIRDSDDSVPSLTPFEPAYLSRFEPQAVPEGTGRSYFQMPRRGGGFWVHWDIGSTNPNAIPVGPGGTRVRQNRAGGAAMMGETFGAGPRICLWEEEPP